MGVLNWFKRLAGVRRVSGVSAPAETPALKQNVPGEELRERGKSGLPWLPAPRSSHVESFRFYDARKFKLLLRTSGKSEIHVRFRTGAEYAYYSPQHELLVRIFNQLAADRHPGQVIWRLLRAKFQYRQLTAGTIRWRPPPGTRAKRKYHRGGHGRREGGKRRRR